MLYFIAQIKADIIFLACLQLWNLPACVVICLIRIHSVANGIQLGKKNKQTMVRVAGWLCCPGARRCFRHVTAAYIISVFLSLSP